MSNLKCFSDGTDTVIAETEDEAYQVWKEHTGADYHDEAAEGQRLLELPGDKILNITDSDDDSKTAMTCTEWAVKSGKTFLCSTEW